MALSVTGITYVSPHKNNFKYKVENQFYLNGTGLKGATLDDLKGTIANGSHQIDWTNIGVVDNSSDTKMLVKGTPWKTHDKDHEDVDSGDVTPTVSNDGSTVSPTVPSDYTS